MLLLLEQQVSDRWLKAKNTHSCVPTHKVLAYLLLAERATWLYLPVATATRQSRV